MKENPTNNQLKHLARFANYMATNN